MKDNYYAYADDGDDYLENVASNVTIWGGHVNDTIYSYGYSVTIVGGAGNDAISGGGGNDIIYGFEDDDMLKITGAFSGTYNRSKKEGYFKVGSTANAITLKEFTATNFNINSEAYKISGNNFMKRK